MRAAELCVRDVVTALVSESAIDAARRMAEMNVGDLIVVDDATGTIRPIGIVTDRDLAIQVLAHPERPAATVTIGEIMHPDPVVATVDQDVEHVIAQMRDHSIRRVPIVDGDGGLQGVLCLDDVFGWMRDQLVVAGRVLDHQGRGPQLRLRHARR